MLVIDATTCKACGVCGEVCPRHIPVTEDGQTTISAEREPLCMSCGHCAAVCPRGSITVEALDPAQLPPLEKLTLSAEQLSTLLRQRRSVRRYKDKPVPRELLERLVEAAHCAPTGTGRAATSLVVLGDRGRIDEMMKIVFAQYGALQKALRNPIARFVIKRRIGRTQMATLRDFVMPGIRWYLRWHEQGKGDEISRDCPAMLLFHGPKTEPKINDSCTIAAFHSLLMAETLGLGACFNHLIPPIINRSPELRTMLGIPAENEAYTAVTLGYRKYKWARTVQHRLAEVRYLD